MLKPGLKRAVQIVGTLALVALAVIAYRRTDWSKGFTPDGIMTLIAGVLAFAAVQWQMWDHRRTSRQEQGNHKRAIAKALLFEVDDFYSNHLMGVYDRYRGFDGSIEKLPGVTGMDRRPFAAYDGNTASLGAFSDEVVRSVVVFYDTARRHLSINRDYKELLREYQYGHHSPEAGQEARQLFFFVRGGIPRLTRLSYEACMKLARLSDVPFRKDVVTVAGEDPEQLARDEEAEVKKWREHESRLHN